MNNSSSFFLPLILKRFSLIAALAAAPLLATAQNPPQVEVPLTAKRAISISFPSTAGVQYQLWRSQDLKNWERYGDLITGTGQTVSLTHITETADRDFFRATTGAGAIVEVVKELIDFKDYPGWQKLRTLIGPDPFLGGAHGNGTLHRSIFVSPSHAQLVNGQYPLGTIFLKELREDLNGQPGKIVDALTVMVKRGGSFNPTGNGWEYFMADPGLTQSLLRGGKDTMCFNCHVAATDKDYVFTPVPPAPAEAVRELSAFKDYQNWKRLGTLLGPDPALGGAHGGGDLHRTVFVYPADAKQTNGEYPVGTVFLKELRANNNGQPGAIVDALTVMVKREGGFNPTGGGWEYFMTDTALSQTLLRGGSETMCFGCHGAAANKDWVFTTPK